MSMRIENWASVEQLVRMSIGTDRGTWHADPSFGSDLWHLRRAGKTDGETAGTLERMVRESLQWLVSARIALSVDCKAERNGKNRIGYTVTVKKPDGGSISIKEAWDAV
jgi:phage gp46-like protein